MTREGPVPITWLLVAADELPDGDDWLSEAERRRQEELHIPKRRAEWRLGRWAAKRVLAGWREVNADPEALHRLEIRTAEDGAPEALLDDQPLPVLLSLSHRAASALAVVAPADDEDAPRRLGCDLELVEPRSSWFLADYLRPEEREVVRAAPAEEGALLANLFWSAKESATKALRRGLTVDTWRLAVELEEGGSVLGPGWRPLTVRLEGVSIPKDGADRFRGGWRREGELVVTVVVAG